jgi:hypothetical protein
VQKALPESEYVDFLNTYEDDKWWMKADQPKKEEDPDKQPTKHIAQDAISEKSGDDDEKDDALSIGNEDLPSPKLSD